ncbi:MAG: hypothetical protein KAS94_09225 [Desulfobulbaceae bacterium]|nr:hypothetical protein [Desulfobulbaceae bacterium]
MANDRPKPQAAPLTEEEQHRRRWLQYALQTPPPRPIKPTNPNADQATIRGTT